MSEWQQVKRSTDPVELDEFSKNDYWIIRTYVAENKNTGTDTLIRLADDVISEVRFQVAKNSNTPLAVLLKLIAGSDKIVSGRAKENLNSRDMLNELLEE